MRDIANRAASCALLLLTLATPALASTTTDLREANEVL